MREIRPNPENGDLEELEVTYKSTADRKMASRLLAIKMLFLDAPVPLVLATLSIDRRTLRRWIHRWNDSGIDGLATQPKPPRQRAVTEQQQAIILDLLHHPEKAGVTHWTGVSLHGFLTQENIAQLGYSTLIRLIHETGNALIVPRPRPVKQDPEERQWYRAHLQRLQQQGCEIWFGDESGFLADPRPRRTWAPKGSTPTTPTTGLHIRQSVIGAVHPNAGELAALVLQRVDIEAFQAFLDQLDEQTNHRPIHLVLDNASWHRSKKLQWHQISPLYLPAYSPDLNPIERLWKVVKDRWFTQWYTDNHLNLENRICTALKDMMEKKQETKSICRIGH
jgi:transposase